jgi:hypothetical protein
MIKKLVGAATLVAAISVTAFAMRGGAESGLKVGEFVSAFHPNHVTGPHKGTDACPPCTYGKAPQVQVWVNGDDAKNVEAIAKLLDKRVGNWDKSNLKAFFIFVTDSANKGATAKKIEDIAAKSGVKIALAWIDKGNQAIGQYKVNTAADVKNTVIVYKDMKISSKFVNLKADEKGLAELNSAIDGITK